MFVSIEGLDGAGKSTQVEMLRQALTASGESVEYLHFPRFDAPLHGELIARFLRGEMGSVEQVDPHLAALLFAGDRAEAAPLIRGWLKEGKWVVTDRYVYSNVAYQSAKCRDERLGEWIEQLEFGLNAIPRPDLNIFLDVPFAFTERRLGEVRTGADREYLHGGRDIHEESLDLQRRVRDEYLRIAARPGSPLKLINCADSSGNMASPDEIFKKIAKLAGC